MRILKVRFQNLNSLAGKWEIDFTDPGYVNDGIFAITGPTGAGKSTLMDAICLGLYGRTPRLKSINSSGNELMTTNTGVCYSEVEFSTLKGSFRSTWSQRRSREKADGNLQPQQMEVAEITSGKEKILTEKIGESLARIEELTGMDYDRFVQSMMLAQGAFAQFLKASPRERSPILEEITGQQLYTELSKKVHVRNQYELSLLKELKEKSAQIPTLSDDERSEQEAIVVDKQREFSTKNNVLQQLFTWQNWLKQLADLEAACVKLEQEKQLIVKSQSDFAPQLHKLERAESAALLDSEFTTYNLITKQKNELMAECDAVANTIPEIEKAYNMQLAALKKTSAELQQLQHQQSELNPILQKVRELDSELRKKNELLINDRKTIEEQIKDLKQLQQELTNLSLKSETLERELTTAGEYIRTHPEEENLQQFAGNLELHFSRLSKLLTEQVNKQLSVTQLEKHLSELIAGEKLMLENLTVAESKLSEIQMEQQGSKRTLHKLTGGRAEQDIRNEVKLLHEKQLLIARIHNLEAQRKLLQDGQACPLCGAEHHPFAEGNIPADDNVRTRINELDVQLSGILEFNNMILRLQQQELKAAEAIANSKNELNLIRQKVTELTERLHQLDTEQQNYRLDIDELNSFITGIIAPFGFTEFNPQKSNAILAELQQRATLWKNATATIKTTTEQLSVIHTGKAVTSAMLTEKQLQLQDLENKLKLTVATFSELQHERVQLFGTKNADEEESGIQRELVNARKVQEKLLTDSNLAEKKLDFSQQRLRELRQQLTLSSQECDRITEELLSKLKKLEFVDMQDFVDARMSQDERMLLHRRRQHLQSEVLRLDTLLNETRERLEREQNKKLTDESFESLLLKEKVLKAEIEQCNQQLIQAKINLQQDVDNRALLGNLLQHITEQKKHTDKWSRLDRLIGSADGSVFNQYAQGLTFEIVLNYANIQLQKLTDRYVMQRDKSEALSIRVLDTYQNNRIRTTDNLSGGESFLFSLALALGLAQISSRNIKIETLFLDEGFGTLDENTLEIALNALNSLHQEGRLIGVISHVSGMKESINTQIVVEKGPMGRSTLRGPGVRQGL